MGICLYLVVIKHFGYMCIGITLHSVAFTRVIDPKVIILCNFDQIQSPKTQPHLMAVMSEMKVVTPMVKSNQSKWLWTFNRTLDWKKNEESSL